MFIACGRKFRAMKTKCTNVGNCRDRFAFTISLSLLTSIRTGPPNYAVTNGIALKLGVLYICLLWLNSQQCGIHHGNRNQKAKVMQSVGSGVAWQGRGGGGKTSTWAFFHILSTLIISCPPAVPCKVSKSQ